VSKIKLFKFRVIKHKEELANCKFIKIIGVAPPLRRIECFSEELKCVSVVERIMVTRSDDEGHNAGQRFYEFKH
jgi:hypothetical protein